jgi:hypothetical protein
VCIVFLCERAWERERKRERERERERERVRERERELERERERERERENQLNLVCACLQACILACRRAYLCVCMFIKSAQLKHYTLTRHNVLSGLAVECAGGRTAQAK